MVKTHQNLCVFKRKRIRVSVAVFLQQKVSVLISDWLPAVINKSTDARKLTSASRNKTVALIFFIFIMDSPVFDLNLFDFENYIPEWENVSDQELVGHVHKAIQVLTVSSICHFL